MQDYNELKIRNQLYKMEVQNDKKETRRNSFKIGYQ